MLFSAVSFVSPQMKGEFEEYQACPESKDTKVLNMYNIFLMYRSDTVNELPVQNFIFQHSRRHCPSIY